MSSHQVVRLPGLLRNAEQLLHDSSDSSDERLTNLHLLGCDLRDLFLSTNVRDAIDGAIRCMEQAVRLTCRADAELVTRRLDLSIFLGDRFELTRSLHDVSKAIDLGYLALDGVSESSVAYPVVLEVLCVHLGNRFALGNVGNLADAHEAIRLGKLALDHPAMQHGRRRAECLHNLSACYGDLFSRSGDTGDIEEAIRYQQAALSCTREEGPERAQALFDLAVCFRNRYKRQQQLEDLQQAIRTAQSALDNAELVRDYATQTGLLHHLSDCLRERFVRAKVPRDLDEAIRLGKSALGMSQLPALEQAIFCQDLCIAFRDRFALTGQPDDISLAIKYGNDALNKTPEEYRPHFSRIHNLGLCYASRSALPSSETTLGDIDEAIRLAESSLQVQPHDHPRVSEALQSLGLYYESRFKTSKASKDLEQSVTCALRALRHKSAMPLTRLMAGLSAASRLAALLRWGESAAVFEESLMLLPSISPRTSSTQDVQEALRRLPSAASLAASTFLKAGRPRIEALQVLEKARGVIASLVLDSPSDVSLLGEQHERLYQSYIHLRDIASMPLPVISGVADSANRHALGILRRSDAAASLESTIDEIRRQPGFESFLEGLSEAQILDMASHGPIIYFIVSSVSTDALVITGRGIECIPLPELTFRRVEEILSSLLSRRGQRSDRDGKLLGKAGSSGGNSRSLESSLIILWEYGVKPVLEKLELLTQTTLFSDRLPRVWWVGSGMAAMLPFHAAGSFSPSSTCTTMTHVVSSYATSLKSLHHCRKTRGDKKASQPSSPPEMGSHQRLLVAAMPRTPGMPGRLSVEDELTSIIHASSNNRWPVTAIMNPNKSEVLAELRHCSIFHFAGHGWASADDPSQSVLCLGRMERENLSVRDVEGMHSKSGKLAYLSACSTAEMANGELLDEGIHLVGAMVLAGFEHVVGTMWRADDGAAVSVAGSFYSRLGGAWDGQDNVARALHEAITALRSSAEGGDDVWKWAPFVHFGP